MKMTGLHALFVDELRDLYSAENQLIKALPKMAKAAANAQLRQGIQEHLEQTKGHAERLEECFKELGVSPRSKKCVAMEGIIEEGKDILDLKVEPEVIDAGIIAAAQKVEHYEIASYGTVRTWAEQMGHERCVELLQQTLDEEKEADQLLTQVAETMVNEEALAVG